MRNTYHPIRYEKNYLVKIIELNMNRISLPFDTYRATY